MEREASENQPSLGMSEPIDMEALISDSRWPLVKHIYADGYHDAKESNPRNVYPQGSLRWHAYQRGYIVADEWFNKGIRKTRQAPAD